MDLIGHGSNPDLGAQLDRVTKRRRVLAGAPREVTPEVRVRVAPRRRAWGSITEAVVTVLGSAGVLRGRDVHEAVEALLGEPVPPSSIKNCLARHSVGDAPRFERLGRGLYRLA
jgi:hypothetical protein